VLDWWYLNLHELPVPHHSPPLILPFYHQHLSRGLESSRESSHVPGNGAVGREDLDVAAIRLDGASLLGSDVLLAAHGGEAPVLGDDDLLAAGELVLGTTHSLECVGTLAVASSDAEENLANLDTGDETLGLAKGTAHTGLETIGSGARQHLVDADDVVGMSPHPEMERILATVLGEVLVGTDTSSLKRLRGELFQFVGHEVNAEREVVDGGTLATEIEDADLGVGHTTVEARLGVRLVLAVTVATSGTTSHLDGFFVVVDLVMGEKEERFPPKKKK